MSTLSACRGIGSAFAAGRGEQAARTFIIPATGVFGWNCTTASRLPNARSKEAQPAVARHSAAAAIAAARIRPGWGARTAASIGRPAGRHGRRGRHQRGSGPGPQAGGNAARAARGGRPGGGRGTAPGALRGNPRGGGTRAPAAPGASPTPPRAAEALGGRMRPAALVGREAAIEGLGVPRSAPPACSARLLGTEDPGLWRICPAGTGAPAAPGGGAELARRYHGDSLILHTEWRTATGTGRLIDFMPPRDGKPPVLARIREGRHGHRDMEGTLRSRLRYGATLPLVRRKNGRVCAVAGPDSLWLDTPVTLTGRDLAHQAAFRVTAGERVPFVLTWRPGHEPAPEQVDADAELARATGFWRDWASRCTYEGPHPDAVIRSLITLKALTYAPTGGIVAAATTSLPEDIGGVRNWDYRYCWLRDATITLEALLRTGYTEEAAAWRAWLERAVAGDPKDV